MQNIYNESFIRNIGIFTELEQEKIRDTTIAVAGVGGVGGLLIERLIRLGFVNIKITDPGTYELSNLNRQFGSSTSSLGKPKAEVIFDEVTQIYPETKIHFDKHGITNESDAIEFISDADLIIDEMDYGAWKESIYLQRAARNKGIYYLFAGAIGFGALLVNFDPHGLTLEEYNGLVPGQDLTSPGELVVGMDKVLPVFPSYLMDAISNEMLQEIVAGQRPVPTCSIGAGLAALMAANNIVNIIIRRKEIIKAPYYIYFDLMDLKCLVGSIANQTDK